MVKTSQWAAILAGGDGTRLRPLTRALTGDDRPKQFCPLLGGRTLLEETMARVSHSVAADCTLYVVSRKHRPFYERAFRSVRPTQVLEQPANRGTAAAIAFALARLRDVPEGAVVGFFPADHYYARNSMLRRVLGMAYAAAALDDRVMLIGAEASSPETEYGWIECGRPVRPAGPIQKAAGIREVTQFWEKPSVDFATELLRRGCLWNTFISVGRVESFISLLESTLPDLWHRFAALGASPRWREDTSRIDAIYEGLAPSDFSRDVLTACPDRLAVVRLPRAGWSDLGHPGRVLDILARSGLPRPVLRPAVGQ